MGLVNLLRATLNPDRAHIIELEAQLGALVDQPRPRPEEVARYLDGLDHSGRVAAVRSLGPRQMQRLFDAVEGLRQTTLDDVVPPSSGVRREVRHYGKNSLPAFTIFEKRFMRPTAEAAELWGYNFQRLSPITGPGYFVARDAPDRGEVDIDYYDIPPEQPPGWPALRPNERGLSRLVYAQMVDRLRGITAQVSIGRAWKKGQAQPAWFVLCRE